MGHVIDMISYNTYKDINKCRNELPKQISEVSTDFGEQL